jgi:hypothetical protein
LAEAASRNHVPLDEAWNNDACRIINQPRSSESESSENELAQQKIDLEAPKKTDKASANKTCPECGHKFGGNGWGGIDAHWRAQHEEIMPYHLAWPIISGGGKPSTKATSG